MVGEYYILLSANTPLAHSLCSYACPHTLDGHAVYVVSLRSIIRTLPVVARGGMLAHSPSLHLGFASTSLSPTLPLVARAFQAVSLRSDFKSCGFIIS